MYRIYVNGYYANGFDNYADALEYYYTQCVPGVILVRLYDQNRDLLKEFRP